MFLLQAANIGLAVYLPVYLQSSLDLSVSQSGIAMLGLLLGTVAGASFSGRMIPRFVHYKRIAMVGVTFAILCLGLLSLVAGHASLLVVELLTTAIGLGTGTTFPVATVSVQNAVDRMHLGVATGVLTFLRSLGSALGVAMLGAVALGYGLPLAEEGSLTRWPGHVGDAVRDDLPGRGRHAGAGVGRTRADAGKATARPRRSRGAGTRRIGPQQPSVRERRASSAGSSRRSCTGRRCARRG